MGTAPAPAQLRGNGSEQERLGPLAPAVNSSVEEDHDCDYDDGYEAVVASGNENVRVQVHESDCENGHENDHVLRNGYGDGQEENESESESDHISERKD